MSECTNTKPNIELLAPAGSRESLTAAVQNGADAVYFGGSAFNARRFASNFNREELLWALDYCHARGVRVNVTFNTLLFDKELAAALDYGRFLYEAGVDAAIVQDLGLVRLLRANLPELVLHASTQMGICDAEGARVAHDMGLSRVVLAREVPLAQVREIAANGTAEVEVFAHGAMCMSVSGACLFSSVSGERSGNRGTCAQPCRKRMAIGKKPGQADYALSLSDLCMLSHMQELAQSGICSIKLEGRMKRAEYVAAATRAYRAALDGAGERELAALKDDLFAMFNRGGERTGYYYGDGCTTGCVAKAEPNDSLLRKLQATYAEDTRKRPVAMDAVLQPGEPARLTLSSEDITVQAEGDTVQRAEKPQDAARYAAQLQKLGNTPFCIETFALTMPETAFLPVGKLNELRRHASDVLLARVAARRQAPEHLAVPDVASHGDGLGHIAARVRTVAQAEAAFHAGADEVLLAPVSYDDATPLHALQSHRAHAKLLLSLPASIISREEHARVAALLNAELLDGAEANNIGQLPLLQHLPLRIAGSSLNAANALCAEQLSALGFNRTVLSQELTKPQMRDILMKTGGAVTVYGRTEAMQLRHCPVREQRGCAGCAGVVGTLVDEAGRAFPLTNVRQQEGCLVRMLNCHATDITDLYGTLPPVDAAHLAFYDEAPAEVSLRVRNACLARAGEPTKPLKGATRGHWARAVD